MKQKCPNCNEQLTQIGHAQVWKLGSTNEETNMQQNTKHFVVTWVDGFGRTKERDVWADSEVSALSQVKKPNAKIKRMA